MSEIIFKSSLSIEEIENNFKKIEFFPYLMSGLKEILKDKDKNNKILIEEPTTQIHP